MICEFINPTPTAVPVPPLAMAAAIFGSELTVSPVSQGDATGPQCPFSAPAHQPLSISLSPKPMNASKVAASLATVESALAANRTNTNTKGRRSKEFPRLLPFIDARLP